MTEAESWIVEDYQSSSGRAPVREFIETLSKRDEARAQSLIRLLQKHGHGLGMPHAKPIGSGLFEVRDGQVPILYIVRPGRRAILLEGCLKKAPALPLRVVQAAKARAKDIIGREGA